MSGMRIASEGFTGYALLGTDFRQEHIRDFQRWHPRTRFIIALDPDASAKALHIAHRWGPAFPGTVEVAILKADPKDYDCSKALLEDLRL